MILDDNKLMERARNASAEQRVLRGADLKRATIEAIEGSSVKEHIRSVAEDPAEIAGTSFLKLLDRCWARVVSTCYGFFPNVEQARELAWEVCLKVWRSRQRLDPSKNFEAFLITTARNHCIDLLRSEVRRGALAWTQLGSTDAPVSPEGSESQPLIDFIADPDSMTQGQRLQLKDVVERVLQRLNPVDRFILVMRFYEGRTRAEIATELACTEQNVGIRERKARLVFQEYFTEEWGSDQPPI